MLKRLSTLISFAVFLALPSTTIAQTDARNVPKPPGIELEKFKPFLGDYEGGGDYVNLKWEYHTGFKTAVKGWHVEFFVFAKT